MTIQTKSVNNALVFYPSDKPWRWIDVVGENVVKYANHFADSGVTTDTMAGWTGTLVEGGGGESTVTSTDAMGGQLLITTDGNDNDGVNLQMDGASWKLSSGLPAYFGIRFSVDVDTQVDFLTGLCVTDTDLLGAMTEGAYFRKVDGSTNVEFVTELGSVESSNIVDVYAAGTYVTYEFYFDGSDMYVYVDSVLTLTISNSITLLPDTSLLTPSIHFLSGVAVTTDEMSIDWLRAFQVQ